MTDWPPIAYKRNPANISAKLSGCAMAMSKKIRQINFQVADQTLTCCTPICWNCQSQHSCRQSYVALLEVWEAHTGENAVRHVSSCPHPACQSLIFFLRRPSCSSSACQHSVNNDQTADAWLKQGMLSSVNNDQTADALLGAQGG